MNRATHDTGAQVVSYKGRGYTQLLTPAHTNETQHPPVKALRTVCLGTLTQHPSTKTDKGPIRHPVTYATWLYTHQPDTLA